MPIRIRSTDRAKLVAAAFTLALVMGPVYGDEGEAGGVEPLPAAMRAGLAELVAAAERWRGLEAGDDVPVGVQDVAALRVRLEELIAEELPPALEPAIERVLVRFGLIPDGLDLSDAYLELLTEQVAGYFDPERGQLVLVRGGGSGAGLPAGASPALGERLEDAILVHEIVHYLQHRHFDLVALLDSAGPLEDRALAVAALVEGDASLAMFDFLLGVGLARMPMVDVLVERLSADPTAIVGLVPGSEALAAAPAFLRENLIFPYLHGLTFGLRLRQAGGQKLLDHAFGHDPPASSEQILHPEKWLERRDAPLVVELPEPAAVLGARWRQAVAGSWGELNVRLILAERLRARRDGEKGGAKDAGAIRARAADAAAGWGGDAFALWRRDAGGGARETVVWITEWDDEAEAAAFRAAAREAFAYWHLRAGGTRVVLASPDLPPSDVRRVLNALIAAPARRGPRAADLDLAALGIDDGDRPQPLTPAEMAALAGDPLLGEMATLHSGSAGSSEGGAAVDELLESPAVQDVLEQAGLGDSPALRQAVGSMLGGETPASTIDDGVLHVPDLGLRFELPAWQEPPLPEGLPIRPLVARADPASGWQLLVLTIPMPIPIEIEMVATGMAMAFGPQGLETVGDGFVQSGTARGYEIEAVGTAGSGDEDGVRIHTLSQTYLVGGRMVQFQALGPDHSWGQVKPTIERALASITFE